MAIRINWLTAKLLMVLLFPLVLMIRAANLVLGSRKPIYQSTIEGDPLAYAGEKPILIAVWADWASVWEATSAVVEELKMEFAGRCEFAYVEMTSAEIRQLYAANIVPGLILRHRGQEIGRFVNTMRADEVRQTLASIATSPSAA